MAKLTVKQELFVEAYLIEPNATEAAKKAGYSEKSAHSTGPRMLENDGVKEAIAKAQAERSERTEIDMDYVLTSLQTVAERCMEPEPVKIRDGKVWKDSGEWKFDSGGANRALELLGRHLGMFKDAERAVPVTIVLQDERKK